MSLRFIPRTIGASVLLVGVAGAAPLACSANDVEIGENQQPSSCSVDTDCGNGQVCEAGECAGPSNAEACVTDSDCPTTQVCGQTGCTPTFGDECLADIDCPNSDQCGHGYCTGGAGICSADADCPLPGQFCTDEGSCTGPAQQGCDTPDVENEVPCPDDWACTAGVCKSPDPLMPTFCVADADCPGDLFCGKDGSCGDGSGAVCSTDFDCPLYGQICDAGQCSGPGQQSCVSTADCPTDQACIAEVCKSTVVP